MHVVRRLLYTPVYQKRRESVCERERERRETIAVTVALVQTLRTTSLWSIAQDDRNGTVHTTYTHRYEYTQFEKVGRCIDLLRLLHKRTHTHTPTHVHAMQRWQFNQTQGRNEEDECGGSSYCMTSMPLHCTSSRHKHCHNVFRLERQRQRERERETTKPLLCIV